MGKKVAVIILLIIYSLPVEYEQELVVYEYPDHEIKPIKPDFESQYIDEYLSEYQRDYLNYESSVQQARDFPWFH